MKILWLSNVLFPEVCKELKVSAPVVGGWMASAADALMKYSDQDIVLAVVSLSGKTSFKHIRGEKMEYFLIPGNSTSQDFEEYFKKIARDFNPEIVHIHGTEYSHSSAYVNACGNTNVVVSIQGLVSVYADYYFGGISILAIKPSVRDIVRSDSLARQKKNMEKRGVSEIDLLKKVNHIIGRTTWDRSHIWALNPAANYHFCNETLRAGFYNKEWTHSNCEPYSIFLSQAHYPIKGIQQLIKALPVIKKHYPSVKVYVAGSDFIDVSRIKKNGFALYMQKLMQQFGVTNDIVFLGNLAEEQMAEQFQKAHVFVCPSAIENSPNSIGEAQLVGVPVVASYVGGSMDMVEDGKTGFLYRFEDTNILAYRICQLFGNGDLCEIFSRNGKSQANTRHNAKINALTLLNIYKEIKQHDTVSI